MLSLPKKVSIIPPTRPPNVKFDITSAMVELLNLKGVIFGLSIDDPNIHLSNFIGICTSYTIPMVDQEALC